MSKIICDVCGTAYPENAAQCPICGSAKRPDAKTVSGNKVNASGSEESTYKFVKGGRFSKKNVRKRNQEIQARQRQQESGDTEDGEKSNKGLIVLPLVILAAVVTVAIYILLRLFNPGPDVPDTKPTDENTNPSTSASTGEPTPSTEPSVSIDATVPCEGLILHVSQIDLDAPGASARLDVSASPADTTDVLTFESSDESVVTVDGSGNVTAVGEGSAVITITCGDFHVGCTVKVDYATEPTTEPTTEPATEPTTEPPVEFELNRSDITMFEEGETWTLYSGSLPLTKIQWYSDDESVATIKNGTVTAVGPGTTTVYGEYEGIKVGCIIRCNWESDDPTTEPTTEPTDPPVLDPNETYTINKSDVKIDIGESFQLTLTDSSGNVVNVDWQASEPGYVEIDGNWITGVSSIDSSSFTVSVTIGDTTYSCIVRVR